MAEKFIVVGYEDEPAVVRGFRRFVGRPSYWETLRSAIGERFMVSDAPAVSGVGTLVVPHGAQTSEMRVGQLGGVAFVPAKEGASQVDMLAFEKQHDSAARASPKYLGTMDVNDQIFSKTEELLRGIGVGVSKLYKTKLAE